MTSVSFIVPTRNHRELMARLVGSLRATLEADAASAELIVVDNGSTDPATLAWLAGLEGDVAPFERVAVLRRPGAFNYPALNNAAADAARGTFLCLLNDDVEAIGTAWLAALLHEAHDPGTGCVGALLRYPDDTVQHAGVALGLGDIAGHVYKHAAPDDPGHGDYLRRVQRVTAVTGACLMIRRALYLELGGLDEALAVAWNDVDLCLRVRATGRENVWTPHAVLYHHESKSRGRSGERTAAQRRLHARESRLMRARWPGMLDADPCLGDRLPAAVLHPARSTRSGGVAGRVGRAAGAVRRAWRG